MPSDASPEGEPCPIGTCDRRLQAGDGGHWVAKPNPESLMAYHTDREGIARHWEHIDGLDVTPATEPYPEGTLGAFKARQRAEAREAGDGR